MVSVYVDLSGDHFVHVKFDTMDEEICWKNFLKGDCTETEF